MHCNSKDALVESVTKLILGVIFSIRQEMCQIENVSTNCIL